MWEDHVSIKLQQRCNNTQQKNDFDPRHILQISKPESMLEYFHFLSKFEDERVESPIFWPENVTASRFCLYNTARGCLSCVDQK